MNTVINPRFDKHRISHYFAARPVYAKLLVSHQESFEKNQDETSTVDLLEFSSQKMVLEKDISFKKGKIYRIAFPGTLNTFESYKLSMLFKGKHGNISSDRMDELYSTYENTLDSILVVFHEDVQVLSLVLWINN